MSLCLSIHISLSCFISGTPECHLIRHPVAGIRSTLQNARLQHMRLLHIALGSKCFIHLLVRSCVIILLIILNCLRIEALCTLFGVKPISLLAHLVLQFEASCFKRRYRCIGIHLPVALFAHHCQSLCTIISLIFLTMFLHHKLISHIEPTQNLTISVSILLATFRMGSMFTVQRHKHSLHHNHGVNLALCLAKNLMCSIKATLHSVFLLRKHQQLLIVELLFAPTGCLKRIAISVILFANICKTVMIEPFHLIPITSSIWFLQQLSQSPARLVIQICIPLITTADSQRIKPIHHLAIFSVLKCFTQFFQHDNTSIICTPILLWSSRYPRQTLHLMELCKCIISPAYRQQADQNHHSKKTPFNHLAYII